MFKRMRRVFLILFSIVLLIATATLSYAYFWERYFVEETNITWELPNWSGRPLTMVVLSDLHLRPQDGDYIDRIVSRVMKLHPDAILLLGDYYNGHRPGDAMSNSDIERHLRPLTQFPCFAVLGNHDEYTGLQQTNDLLQALGIPNVSGKSYTLKIGGHPLRIGGVHCTMNYTKTVNVPVPEPGVPFLLLSHSPEIIGHAAPGTDLILAGHTHGGQICLPWGRRIGPAWFFGIPANRTHGLVQEQGQSMYVSRGLGTSILPLRLFCRPELPVLHLLPSQNSQQK